MRCFVVGAALLLAGCGGSSDDKWTSDLPETVDASGIILLDGKPLDFASIVLVPIDAAAGHAATAVSNSSGKFWLKAFPSKDGAVPGGYLVTVTKIVSTTREAQQDNWGEDDQHAADSPATTTTKNILPTKYENPQTSGLELSIPQEGRTDLKLELNSK